MAKSVTVRLDEEVLGALDRLAERSDQSRDWFVERAIESYIALRTSHERQIEAGVEAADRSDFASDADIERLKAKFSADA